MKIKTPCDQHGERREVLQEQYSKIHIKILLYLCYSASITRTIAIDAIVETTMTDAIKRTTNMITIG